MIENKDLIRDLEIASDLLRSGKQHDFIIWEISRAKQVSCVPMCEVFSSNEIDLINSTIEFRQNECFRNALLLAELFPYKCIYVEGRILCHGIPLEHAFCKIGDLYVDPTVEVCLEEDVTQEVYCSFVELDAFRTLRLLEKTKIYGSVPALLFEENNKNTKL